MKFIYGLTVILVIISFLISPKKTKKAVKVGAKKLWKITPPFVSIIVVISFVLYFLPNDTIVKYLGDTTSYMAIITALGIGSITVMPGPIVYPLCSILVINGVSYSIIAAFSTSLMMVGIVTFPVESTYFGKNFAILRNITSIFISLIVALVFSMLSGWMI
ncbi:MAG: permease [Clostridiales bacterium]|nr:permease [Clostridiales bacterium]